MRKFIKFFTVFLVVSVLFTGWGRKKPRYEITFLMWGSVEEKRQMEGWLEKFHKRFPEIKVKCIHVPEYNSKLFTMCAGGTPPDVFMVSNADLGLVYAFVKKGFLLPLDDFVNSPENREWKEDIRKEAWNVFTINGHIYAVPRAINAIVLFYNKDLFDKEGIPYPEETWDWKKLLEVARKLTKEENKDFIDLMYKCTNEENCKVWCPFDFSVVSLLESVRDDLNDKGLMPDYCKAKISNLHETGTIENYNIFKTYKEKGIENISSNESVEVFYYVGCEMMKFPDVVNANIRILRQAGIKFSVEFEKRNCCGAVAFNVRDMKTAKDFAEKNANLLSESGAKIIVSDCPGCVLTLTERYEKLGVKIDAEIIHIAKYFSRLIDEGKLSFKKELQGDYNQVTIHDPCLLARNLKDTTSIRKILTNLSRE